MALARTKGTAMPDGYMNPSYGNLMGRGEGAREQDEGPLAKKEERKRAAQDTPHKPHIHIHPHHDEDGKHIGTSVHILHHDGTHEKHDHESHDHEGAMSHYHEHYGGGAGTEPGELGAAPGDEY